MENKFNIGDFVSYFENDKELNDESFIHKLKNMHNGYRLEEIVNGKICQIIFDEDKTFQYKLKFYDEYGNQVGTEIRNENELFKSNEECLLNKINELINKNNKLIDKKKEEIDFLENFKSKIKEQK
ncbi:MAG: hypothetical protein IKP65_05720 [Alphaproteobacteria bacterium]|nr:hypothetical protein [Alphaproteobacteria bacterium]